MTTFRRAAFFSGAFLLLILLAASPVTAPFSTFGFVDSSHTNVPVVHKTVDFLRANDFSMTF